jgi:hypothetical protein
MFWDIFWALVIITLSSLSTVSAWFGKEADNRKSGWQKLLPTGKKIFWILTAAIIVTGVNAYRSAISQQNLIDTINITKANSDSLMIANNAIKSILNLISIHSDSAGKLFISNILQSTDRIVKTVKDSSKRNTYGPDPAFGICPGPSAITITSHDDTSYRFDINYCYGESPQDVNMTISIAGEYPDSLVNYGTIKRINHENYLLTSSMRDNAIYVRFHNHDPNNFHFAFHGTLKNKHHQSFPINEFYTLKVKTNEVFYMKNEDKVKIKRMFKKALSQ